MKNRLRKPLCLIVNLHSRKAVDDFQLTIVEGDRFLPEISPVNPTALLKDPPVPKVDLGAFREAIANALVHRDYHQRGAIHVRLEDEALVISNPGGLVDGVTLGNLLTTEPRPRNPRLADVMKRVGIVERSGRGIDNIYRGLLRYGRTAPDYSRTYLNNKPPQYVYKDLTNLDKNNSF